LMSSRLEAANSRRSQEDGGATFEQPRRTQPVLGVLGRHGLRLFSERAFHTQVTGEGGAEGRGGASAKQVLKVRCNAVGFVRHHRNAKPEKVSQMLRKHKAKFRAGRWEEIEEGRRQQSNLWTLEVR
jgi:hypothetical protein